MVIRDIKKILSSSTFVAGVPAKYIAKRTEEFDYKCDKMYVLFI
jgi:hypothetical protein